MSAKELKKRGFKFFKLLVFFSSCRLTNPKPPRMMSSSANDRPFLGSFRHIPPQESFVQLAYLTIQMARQKMAAGEKGLFGQTWVKILREWTPGHLQG